MSIPLDRLYQYIENVAQESCNNTVLIYRFYPHGSKNIQDLLPTKPKTYVERKISKSIICNDQEPLNFDFYSGHNGQVHAPTWAQDKLQKYQIKLPDANLCVWIWSIFDKKVLLHSELRSPEVFKYSSSSFIPAYYWSHALIAHDWYRFGQHINFQKNPTKTFLIYNRAWCGTREYRLKFVECLIDQNIEQFCQTSFCPQDSGIHYTDHQFINQAWKPTITLEDYLPENNTLPTCSADFDENDYANTEIEVVLETLFDDERLHLTEKTLRPIALGQPFILMATHGSLNYLRRYGFKTFDGIINEEYDNIVDPVQRMHSVIESMKSILSWTPEQKKINMHKLKIIAEYNKKWFYNKEFLKLVTDELKTNLTTALDTLESTNTSQEFFQLRKQMAQHDVFKSYCKTTESRKQELVVVSKARYYYNRYLKTLNK
jgi:hypothetical protein